jgi:hypothetical protein
MINDVVTEGGGGSGGGGGSLFFDAVVSGGGRTRFGNGRRTFWKAKKQWINICKKIFN